MAAGTAAPHDLLRNAYSEHQRGNLNEAARLYGEVLRADPHHLDALCLSGVLHAQRGELEHANAIADRALRQGGGGASAYKIGCLLQNLDRHEEARAEFDRALAANPNAFEVLVHRGTSLMALGAHGAALESFDRALAQKPREAGIWLNRGNALLSMERFEEAIANYDRALALDGTIGDAWINRGKALTQLGWHDEALQSYDRAMAARPGDLAIWNIRGAALNALRRFEEAVANSDSILAARPDDIAALMIRGTAHDRLRRHADALADFDRVLALDAARHEALFQRANALNGLGRYREALDSVERYLAQSPGDADALVTKGAAQNRLGFPDDALAAYDAALACNPRCIEALANRGGLLGDLKRFEEAAADLDKALSLKPDFPFLPGLAAQYRLQACDWSRIEQDRGTIAAAVAAGQPVIPFVHLSFASSPGELLANAERYAQHEHPAPPVPLWHGQRYAHPRIKLAYVSADFRVHPMAFLMADIFEHHDKRAFETIAVSFGPDDASPMRRRLEGAFERFEELRGRNASDIARAMRTMEVDIAVDLMGYTTGSRTAIFAARPAPVQVNYLGFAGSMGAEYIDYILADRIVIPEENRQFYAEKVACLPDSFMPGMMGASSAKTPSRVQAGLRERGFVFSSFNNTFKFTPALFDIWMRLLRAVEGSVLWLAKPNDAAIRNLAREAESRGVAATRIIYAPYCEEGSDHLARLALADLFLDTLPYNAHATANDALRAGVPVVTMPGIAFAGRVAASLNAAIGLSEFNVTSLADYEALALNLARDPAQHAAVKAKLRDNCTTQPLFDAARFTRHLEAAYRTMRERAERGLPPESFTVPTASKS